MFPKQVAGILGLRINEPQGIYLPSKNYFWSLSEVKEDLFRLRDSIRLAVSLKVVQIWKSG
jgi:hypothetical protein